MRAALWRGRLTSRVTSRMVSASSLQQQILLRSMESVIMDIAVDEPIGFLPQPNFSDSAEMRRSLLQKDPLAGVSSVEPFNLIRDELSLLNQNIKDLLGSDHPVLATVATYFFGQEAGGGKKMRPALVLLMARATHNHSLKVDEEYRSNHSNSKNIVLASQLRLAEIAEMVHTASLLHDDVIDVSDTRRGVKSVNQMFGNKLAILAGDFLLARTSVCLARLRNIEVIEVMSTVIEHLVKGEVMQMKALDVKGGEAFEYYLRKNYYKTGSLIANSILSGVILGGHSESVRQIAFEYGESLGHAYQLCDDALDFEGSMMSLGKPALADLKQGLATAPVLFAQEDFPELRPLIDRKFSGPTDVDVAATYVHSSDSIQQTKDLARAYSQKAIRSVMKLEPSPERDALVHLACKVVERNK